MKIITSENAPMQLRDFMNLPDNNANIEEEKLYWYNIKKEQNKIVLTENKEGERYALLKEVVEKARDLNGEARSKGVYLEFGFGSGATLNFIAALANNSFVYGFDSGNGIGSDELSKRPYAYTKTCEEKNDGTLILTERKEESEEPVLPFSPLCNVCLYLGEIENTLPHFLQKELHDSTVREYISFVFIDINDNAIAKKIIAVLFQYLNEETILIIDRKLSDADLHLELQNLSANDNNCKILTQKNALPNLQDLIQFPPDSEPWRGAKDSTKPEGGRNILHFNSKNRTDTFHSYASMKSLREKLVKDGVPIVESDSEILKYAVELSRIYWKEEKEAKKKLYFLEFGFCSGRSINFISALLEKNEFLYGFDSGEGLPIDWRAKFPKGTFRYTKKIVRNGNNIELHPIDNKTFSSDLFIPFIPASNVNLVLGEIKNEEKDVLDQFINQHLYQKQDNHLAMIFIDTDLYETACAILEKLSPYIINEKTLIVFDEAFNFKGEPEDKNKAGEEAWKHYEFKALTDFSEKKGRYGYTNLAYNENGQQLLIHFDNK